jgi:ABC-type glycerol-3-phosphate transport system substrate-binding protein
MKTKLAISALCAVLLLAACGGSSEYGAESPPQAGSDSVPARALASTRAFSEFAGSMMKTETGVPIMVNGINPPTSETEAPIEVN